jgi:hypothetical protein
VPWGKTGHVHNATFCWLYHALRGTPATAAVFQAVGYKVQTTWNQMAGHYGKPLNKPAFGDLSLTPGTVIVFFQNGQAGHSCVAKSSKIIAGYNQTNWFNGYAGIADAYTEHSTDNIEWIGRVMQNRVQRPSMNHPAHQYNLVGVPEQMALRAVSELLRTA